CTPDEDVIRPVVTHLGPGRGLLVPGTGIGEGSELEIQLFGQGFQNGDRLASEGRVDVHQGDLLALNAPLVLRDVVDKHGGLRPVGRHHRKDVGEDLTIAGISASVERGDQHHLVFKHAVHQGAGNGGGEEVEEDSTFLLRPVVGLDPALRFVAVIAYDGLDLDSVEAAFLVDKGQIVSLALVVFARHEGVDGGEVLQQTKLDRVLLAERAARKAGGCREGGGQNRFLVATHRHFLLFDSPFLAWGFSTSGMAEGPDQEVFAKVVVDLGEAQRLEQQEADDERAIDHQGHVRDHVGGNVDPAAGRQPRHEVGQENRREQHEAGPQKAADGTSQAADQDHRHQLDGDVEGELLRRHRAVVGKGQDCPADPAQEGGGEEGGELGAEGIDADHRRREVLVPNGQKRAPEGGALHVEEEQRHQHDPAEGQVI